MKKCISLFLCLLLAMVCFSACTIKETVIDPFGLSITVPGVWQQDGHTETTPGAAIEQSYKTSDNYTLQYGIYYVDDVNNDLDTAITILEIDGYTINEYDKDFKLYAAYKELLNNYVVYLVAGDELESEMYIITLTVEIAGIDDIEQYVENLAESAAIN